MSTTTHKPNFATKHKPLALLAPTRISPVGKDILHHAWTKVFPPGTPLRFTTDPDDALFLQESGHVLLTLGAYKGIDGIKTLSQAQIETRPNALTALVAAFHTAWRHAYDERIPRPASDYTLVDDAESFTGCLAHLEGAATAGRVLVVDIETQGDINVLHHSERQVLCIGLYDGEKVFVVGRNALADEHTTRQLGRVLAQSKLVAHNGQFDLPVLVNQLADCPRLRLHGDTMILHYLLHPAASGDHNLETVVYRYLDFPSWKGHGMDMTNLAAADPQQLHDYNADDAINTWCLYQYLLPRVVHDPKVKRLYEEVMLPASNALQLREPDGIAIDVPYTSCFGDELQAKADAQYAEVLRLAHEVDVDAYNAPLLRNLEAYRLHIEAKIDQGKMEKKEGQTLVNDMCKRLQIVEWPYARTGGKLDKDADGNKFRRFNPASPVQIKQLYHVQGIELEKTDAEVMEKRAKDGDAFAAALLEWRGTAKLISTYVTSLLAKAKVLGGVPRARVFPSYRLTGTTTGRLASAGPNIQNIPREKALRRIFVPRSDDRLLVQVDYAQAELRVMACLAEDEWLQGIFNDPTVDFFNGLLPTAYPGQDISSWDEATAKENRARLKGVIYGMSYGRGTRAIAESLEIPAEQAQAIVDNYLASAHKVADWRMDVKKAVINGWPLITPFGRHFQHEVVTPRGKHAAINAGLAFLPQSTASDICLTAGVGIIEHTEAAGRGWKVVALVHDAITLDVPIADAEEAGAYVLETMKMSAIPVFPQVPFEGEIKYGTDWSKTS